MTPPDYEYLRKLLKDSSGLDLSADKQYLIESRLLPLSRKCQEALHDVRCPKRAPPDRLYFQALFGSQSSFFQKQIRIAGHDGQRIIQLM